MSSFITSLKETKKTRNMDSEQERAYALGYQIGIETVKVNSDTTSGLEKVNAFCTLVFSNPERNTFFARLGFMQATTILRCKVKEGKL
jgi:hypothetical protein